MAVQVVTSMAIITTTTTPCSSGATITQRRVSSSCSSVPSRMVVGLEIGSKGRMGSLSLCNPQIRSAGILNSSEFLREKCSLALGNTVCRQAVQALSDTESAEGHVTIVEDCEYLNKIFLWFWTLSLSLPAVICLLSTLFFYRYARTQIMNSQLLLLFF